MLCSYRSQLHITTDSLLTCASQLFSIITPLNTVLLEKLIVAQPTKKFIVFDKN